MATIDLANLYDTSGGNTKPSLMAGGARKPYYTEVVVDMADAVTAKGSALAAADVIEVINVGPGTMVLGAGLSVVAAHEGTSTDTAFDLGITGGDVDQWVDGFDFDGASVGDYSAVAAGATTPTLVSSADTIDILIQAMTGTTTGGKLRVWALMLDITDADSTPGRAVVGS